MKTIMKKEYIILSILLILGFIVRLYKINGPIADWHSWRQADTTSVSKTFVQKGIDLLHPRYHDISSIQTGLPNPQGFRMVEFPIYNAFHAMLFTTFGKFSFEEWGRLLSISCSLISAFFIYLLGKRFVGSWGGILAAFFFLFIPYNVYYSRVILPEPMAAVFALASLWFFVKFIDKDRTSNLILSGVLLSLGLLVKPFVIFYSVPMIYLAISKYSFKSIISTFRILVKFLIFTDIVFIPLLLWRAWIGKFPEGIPFTTWMFNGDGIRFHLAFFRWIFGERLGYLILGIWGLVPFSLGLVKSEKKNLFNLVFFAGMLLYVVIFATVNVRHDYYQVFLIPSISLLLAQGVNALWTWKEINKYLARLLAVFSIVMMIGMGAYQVKEYYKINHPEIIEAGSAVDQLAPKDALVVAPYMGDTAFLYQTNRWGWPAIDDSIDNIIKKGASYYVSVNIGDADTQMVMNRFTVVKRTDTYVIVNLLEPAKSKTK
jgi:4-amino-4-deoxy-L-arabinose transferase-like glycosyltransferase